MLLNIGEGLFVDVSEGVGLSALGNRGIMGTNLADIDNDGDLDLIIGFYPHSLFLNNGDGTFVDQTDRSGIKKGGVTISVGDFNSDGFLDVLTGGGLFRNNGNNNHWLQMELVGRQSNRNGIGVRVISTSGDLVQMREILGGKGYDQDEMVVHFGLGQRTQIDRLEIRWPLGKVDVLHDIPVDQKIRVIEGRQNYHVVQPTAWESISPDTLVIGSTVDFTATVRPILFEAEAEITRVTADLSALGGAVVSLTETGEGTFLLETLLTVKGYSGIRNVSIMVDQNTSLGPYWTRLSRSIPVFPREDLPILDEGLGPGWQVDGTGGVEELDLRQTDRIFQGNSASTFRVKPEKRIWEVSVRPHVPVDMLGYMALRFAFHPGDAVAEGFVLFSVSINGNKVDLVRESLEGMHVDLDQRVWQVVEIPLAAIGVKEPIRNILFSGNLEGTFYLDDIRLVAAKPPPSATAVLEEHTATLPQSFTLDQNYPNPFNGSTVIRFALPEAQNIELSIYNLAGQQVATLVEGMRAAGAYTVNWNGKDDRGNELASGVYVYRLRASDEKQVETRKLLLLR